MKTSSLLYKSRCFWRGHFLKLFTLHDVVNQNSSSLAIGWRWAQARPSMPLRFPLTVPLKFSSTILPASTNTTLVSVSILLRIQPSSVNLAIKVRVCSPSFFKFKFVQILRVIYCIVCGWIVGFWRTRPNKENRKQQKSRKIIMLTRVNVG